MYFFSNENLQIPPKQKKQQNKEFPFTKFFKQHSSRQKGETPRPKLPPSLTISLPPRFTAAAAALHLAPSCPLIHKHNCALAHTHARTRTQMHTSLRCFVLFLLFPLAALLRHEYFTLYFLLLIFCLIHTKLLTLICHLPHRVIHK